MGDMVNQEFAALEKGDRLNTKKKFCTCPEESSCALQKSTDVLVKYYLRNSVSLGTKHVGKT